jgi:hypothetical protein
MGTTEQVFSSGKVSDFCSGGAISLRPLLVEGISMVGLKENGLRRFGIPATSGPIMAAPGDNCRVVGLNDKYDRKTCLNATLFTTNPTCQTQ